MDVQWSIPHQGRDAKLQLHVSDGGHGVIPGTMPLTRNVTTGAHAAMTTLTPVLGWAAGTSPQVGTWEIWAAVWRLDDAGNLVGPVLSSIKVGTVTVEPRPEEAEPTFGTITATLRQ